VSFKPDWRSPPLDTILDILETRGMDLGETQTQLGFMLDEHLVIDEQKARKLSDVLGAPAQFWLNREWHYREP
jgi:HTH-type transcriptional regulator/antitoxin HigA